MPVSANTLRALLAAGVQGDHLIAVVAAIDADMAGTSDDSAWEKRKAWDRERKRQKTNSTGNSTGIPPAPQDKGEVSPAPLPTKTQPLSLPLQKDTPKRVSQKVPPQFEEFWRAYPKRKGGNPRHPASLKFEIAVKQGADPEAIVSGARRYALAEAEHVGTEFIAQAVTWLNQRRWEDYQPQAPPGANLERETRLAELREHYSKRKASNGHSDDSAGLGISEAPPEIRGGGAGLQRGAEGDGGRPPLVHDPTRH